MTWIATDADLPEKPKVRQMARSLGLDRWSVAGRLVSVWGWFDKASTDGFIAGTVAADVDDLAGHDGFADAMQLVGWLVIEQNGLLIPDFDDHHGNSAKKRALGALRQGRYRKRKGDAQSVTGNAPNVTKSSTDTQERDVSVTLQASPQNITEENKEKEQERRAREVEKGEQPSAAGLACRAIMAQGIQANPSHPELLAAIAEGTTAQEFGDAAAECKAKGKGFAYLLAMVRRRKAETAAPVKPPSAKPREITKPERRLSDDERKRTLGENLPAILKQIGVAV